MHHFSDDDASTSGQPNNAGGPQPPYDKSNLQEIVIQAQSPDPQVCKFVSK